MNETFKRRLIGLILVLALLFGLSWLLPRDGKGGSGDVPATVVPLPVTETAAPIPGDRVAAGGTSSAGNESPSSVGAGEGATTPQPDEVQPVAPTVTKPPSSPKPAPPPARKPDKPATPSPVTATPTVPPPAKPTSTPSPADARIWYVQIGSFADQRNAQTTLSLLNGIGFRGESVAIAGTNGTSLYRVRLGPFPNEAAARQAQDKVAHQGYPQCRALSEPAHAP